MRRSCLVPALAAALSLAPAVARAGESPAHAADLAAGPLLGGQDLRLDLRTGSPSSLFALFYGVDGAPTLAGALPPIGVNLAAPHFVYFGLTDSAGRFAASLPTAPGAFGPAGTGAAFFFHAFVVDTLGHKRPGNVVGTEVEPLPAVPGFLADEAATSLPSGYDTLGGVAVEAADVTRDGYPDLLIATDLAVAVWRNDGAGHFLDESFRLPHPGDALSTLRSADMDVDGDLDVLTGGGYDDFVSPPDRLWLNDGTGLFTASAGFPAGEGLASAIELADVDGNGLPDVVVSNGSEGHLSVPGGADALLLNFGGGSFLPIAAFAAAPFNDPIIPSTGVRAGDMDSDGDLDLYVCKQDTTSLDGTPGQPNLLLENDGLGNFSDVAALRIAGLKSDNTQDARFVDLDGDLDLDVVVANSIFGVPAASSNDVLINQGGLQGGAQGFFADDPASFLEATLPGDGIRLAAFADDIDADGDADVLVTTHDLFAGADLMLFLNQGGAQHGTEGVFVRQSWFDPPFSGTGGLGDFICFGAAIFDADLDGDREVALCGAGVVTADPQFQFTTRYLVNGQL
jgi:hypothetical protein